MIDNTTYRTKDGYDFEMLGYVTNGDIIIRVNNQLATLDRETRICADNDGYSLVSRCSAARPGETVRYVNMYRAADGGVCFGRKSYATNEERLALHDTQRALSGLRIVYNEDDGAVSATRAPSY